VAVPTIAPTQVQYQPDSSNPQGSSGYPEAFEDVFDSNLSEKLKDPEMQQEFDKVLDYANKLLFKDNGVLQFSRHEATSTTLIKLVDSKTKEVLKEFPPEKILNMIADLWEVAGLVVNKKA
jgi:flagellar protein FlaG